MGRLRALVLLVSLLVLPGCFGIRLPSAPTAMITGTVRIVAVPESGDFPASASSGSSAGLLAAFGFRAGASETNTYETSVFRAPSGAAVPVEVIVYGGGRSDDEVRRLAEESGFTYVRRSRDGYYVLRDRLGRSAARAVGDIRIAARGARVEANRPLYLMAAPNDSFFWDQWALAHINITAAWDELPEDLEPVIVAVVDTGIDFDHPDLNDPALWVDGWDFTLYRDENYDGPGEPYGYNQRAALRDNEQHGTQVAALIGALTNNGVGIAGVAGTAPVKLMPIRVFWYEEKGPAPGFTTNEEVVAQAVRFAVEHGARVINLSLGSTEDCRTACPAPLLALQEALNEAHGAGVVVVGAAGNYGGEGGPVTRPANHPTVIAVGATTVQKQKAGYSGHGPELALVAPGGAAGGQGPGCGNAIRTLGLNGNYPCATGTSMAAPHVSGIAALMIAAGVASHPDEIRQILQITAEDLNYGGSTSEGWDAHTGYGLVNAYGALTAGVPEIFIGKSEGNVIAVREGPVRPGLGGEFSLSDVPEGNWTLYGWFDRDASGMVNEGDYFGAVHGLVVGPGRSAGNVKLVLTRYEGAPITVNR